MKDVVYIIIIVFLCFACFQVGANSCEPVVIEKTTAVELPMFDFTDPQLVRKIEVCLNYLAGDSPVLKLNRWVCERL